MGGEIIISVNSEQDWKDIVHRCFRCGYCKFTADYSDFNCPSYKKYRFETYSTGGRMWTIYGLISGEIPWNNAVANVLYACSTCGNCMENCKFDKFKDFLIDFIEAARKEAYLQGFCPEKQKALLERIEDTKMYNPYGEKNSDNVALKREYNLPDVAEWIYFIGCTSNYRQKELRDATLRFLKKAKINFTLINEHCCCSPIIRTGQTDSVKDFISYNLMKIRETGASKIITSCAGCYRTMKSDWTKYDDSTDIEIFHTIELINNLLKEGKFNFKTELNRKITYHDPCHLGRHMKMYEVPRDILNNIPGVELIEMERNRGNAWCCGAGGGVKIGYPEWSLEIARERLEEAKKIDTTLITSACPFCRTNLNDANKEFEMGFEILDIIEIIDNLDYDII